jgi:hypothetical protein
MIGLDFLGRTTLIVLQEASNALEIPSNHPNLLIPPQISILQIPEIRVKQQRPSRHFGTAVSLSMVNLALNTSLNPDFRDLPDWDSRSHASLG